MPDETQQDWFADGLRFSCTQCGNCCSGPPGFVWFNEDEGKAMAQKVGLPLNDFLRTFARTINGKWSLKEVASGSQFDCVFLQRDDKGKALCRVYEARPQQCRTWPFWPELLGSRMAWDRAAQRCPGMNHGNYYPADKIRIIRASNPAT